MAKKYQPPPPPEIKQFQNTEEIDRAIAKLNRRITELEQVDLAEAVREHTGAEYAVAQNIRQDILEIYGPNSPEYRGHEYLRIWAGSQHMGMTQSEILGGVELGRTSVIVTLNNLISRLKEKREEILASGPQKPSTYFDRLNLHPRIVEVARDRFFDGYHWDAVFAAAKALINYVKDRSQRHDLDGAPLMRNVFSKNDPILAFNDLNEPTDFDEQEGMMHLFEGAVLGIRNPGGHSFPEGTEQRAVEYISLLSLLAYRVQEARLRRRP